MAVFLLTAGFAEAQSGFRPPVSDVDPNLLKIEEVKFLGLKLDENLAVAGVDGRERRLGDFSGRPLILIFSYFTCDGLCPAFNAEMTRVLEKVVSFKRVMPGRDFNVLTVSFDKNDTVESAAMFARSMNIPENIKDSWFVGIFKNPTDIAKTTLDMGFKYFWSPGDRVFLHSNLYYFVSPELRIARILQNGAEPLDMELAILDSKFDKLKPSEAMNMAFGLCYSYNYKDGKYRLNYPMFISFGSLVSGAAALFIAVRVYKKKAKDSRGGLDMRNTLYRAIAAVVVMASAATMAYGGDPAAGGASVVINDPAEGWNTLWDHVLVDLYVIGIVFSIVALYFIFAYPRRNEKQEGSMPVMSRGTAMAWAIIPSFIFLADDFYLAASGWKLWNDQRRVPAGALEIQLTGQMYNWTFDYGNGVTNDTDSEGRPILTVPAGKPVAVRMRSEDVVHSFFIPDFRIKEDLMPGRVTYLWFYPKAVGEHVFTCTEYCGMGHSAMWGKVKIVPQADFDKFLQAMAPAPAPAPVTEAQPEAQTETAPSAPAGGTT
jgi:heme/copper-type cytochrome/quinol oxidase subunit 2/cytochrome oxidase Cu insertion factor (SCO1/SenC/PrrC family)